MLLRGTDQEQRRKLMAIGAAFLVALVVIAGGLAWSIGDGEDGVMLAIEVPTVGQGVRPGTDLVLHGVAVGEVTAVTGVPGGVRVDARLARTSAATLTDTLEVDFRPANYFGVTAVNLRPGSAGGGPLRDGVVLTRSDAPNFTMQTLLSQLGDVSDGVVTGQLIQVVDKATRYTDGLTPLIESGLIAANAVARVQTVSTDQLMGNATGVSAAFPTFLEGAISASEGLVTSELVRASQEEYDNQVLPTLDVVANSFFGAFGHLLSSHQDELLPATAMVGAAADVVPSLVGGARVGPRAAELRTRLERMFLGDPGEQAVRLRIVLDGLPGLAAGLDPAGLLAGIPGGPR